MMARLEQYIISSAILFTLLLLVKGIWGCGTPPSVSHARVATSTVNSMEIATYTCDSANGYATRGNNTIACLRLHGYSIWTTVSVRCLRVLCSNIPSMIHATHDFLLSRTNSRTKSEYAYRSNYNYYYGYYQRYTYTRARTEYYSTSYKRTVYYTGYVTFTCATNYFLPNGSGTARTYCGDRGRWVTPDASCQGRNCGALPTMDGVTCSGVSTRYPARRSCRCNTGYERVNSRSFTRTCLPSGSWSAPTDSRPALCTRVICGQLQAITNSNHRKTIITGTRYRDTATYTCLPGYEVKGGSYVVTCQANRRWSTLPTCTRKDCGKPSTIENGEVHRHLYNTTFDSEVEYICSSLGYTMVGSATIRCSEDGEWSTYPVCHEVNCGPPAVVPHSKRTVFGHSYNDNVTYECDVGYRLTGNSSIYCQVIGHWTIPPTCHSSGCGEPPMVKNALNATLTSGTTVGDKIRYTCQSGYKMSGYSIAECLPSLQWSALPSCNKVNCGPPAIVPHSKRTVFGHSYNDNVTYECDVGYRLTGNSSIYCQVIGHWTIPPTCRSSSCGEPPEVENALNISSTSGTSVGDKIRYRCLSGYKMSGYSVAECLPSLQWSALPYCNKVNCGPPAIVPHSRRTVFGHFYNDNVMYECDIGYRLTGTNSIYCQAIGHWTMPPSCRSSGCGKPPGVENAVNATLTGGTSVGDKIIYRCQNGYKMSGYSIAECLPSLKWSALPYCNKVNCGPPAIVSYSRRTVFGHSYNDNVTYECNVGYRLTGNSSIYCQEIGHWTMPPTCRSSSCGEPPEVENALHISTSGTSVDDKIRYTCQSGYKMSGYSIAECLPSLQWSALPYCNRIRCGNPPSIQNGIRHVRGYYLNDTAEYNCHLGYLISGNAVIRCQSDSHWSTSPECNVISCGVPPTSQYAHIRAMSGFQLGNTITYQCLAGHFTSDPNSITCQLNGTWSQAPNCHSNSSVPVISCGVPPVACYAHVSSMNGFQHGDTVTYECAPGYITLDPKFVTCQRDGTWNTPPNCTHNIVTTTVPARCEEPPEVENALNISSTSGTSVGDKIRYRCLSGYKMFGYSIAECLPSLQWSALPYCNRIRCGNPPSIQNSIRRVRGHYLNDITEYECLLGYQISGNAVIRCQSDGYWSLPPDCHAVSCGKPPAIKNAYRRSMDGLQFGNTITYQCMAGFLSSDPQYITCQADGTWSTLPHCERRMVTTESTAASSLSQMNTTLFSKFQLSSYATKKRKLTPVTFPESITNYNHEPLSRLTTTQKTEPTTKWVQKTTERLPTQQSTLTRRKSTHKKSGHTNPFKITKKSTSESAGARSSMPPTTNAPTKVFSPSTATRMVQSKSIPNSTKITLRYTEEDSNQPSTRQQSVSLNGVVKTTEVFTIPPVVEVKPSHNNSGYDNITWSPTQINLFNKTAGEHNEVATMQKKSQAGAHKTSSTKNARTKLIIAGTVTSVTLVCLILLAVKLARRRRSHGEHHFVPVSNALFEADGHMMRTYSFKEGSSDDPQ